MATSKAAEATIVIKAQDETSAVVDKIHTRLMGMSAPLAGMRDKLSNAFPHAQVAKFQDALAGLNGKLATVGLGMAGMAVGGMAMAKSGFDAIVDTAAKADRIADMGGRLRLNAEEFQVFEKLAKESGASVEEVGGAFLKFKLNLQQAHSEGGDKLKKLNQNLAAFGITAQQASEMKPLDLMKLMGKVSAASGTEKDELLKIDMFRQLAGKTGATLIPVFEAIGMKYDATVKGMIDSGQLMSDEMVQQGEKAYKSWERAKNQFGGLKMAFGIEMMPVFERFSSALEARAKANRGAVLPGIKEFADQLTGQVEPFLDGMERASKTAGGMFKALSTVASLVGWDSVVFGGFALVAAPFVAAAGSVIWSLGRIVFAIGQMTLGPVITGLRGLATTFQLLGFTAAQSWLMILGPVALVVAGIALVAANWNEMGAYFSGAINRIREATSAAGLFGGIWQTVKELALAPLNAIIGSINIVLNLLAKVGIGSGGSIGLVGVGGQGATGPAAAAPAGAVPATAPTTSRAEVAGKMVIEVKDGRTDVKSVETNNRNFNIDALAGGMFAGNAL